MAKREYSTKLMQIAQKNLDKQNIKYDSDDDNGILTIKLPLGKDSMLNSDTTRVIILSSAIVSYSIPPISANESKMDAVAEFITRANYGLRKVNFELDYNDGEIKCKCFNHWENQSPTEEEIDDVMFFPHYMWQKYGNGLSKVIFGDANPKLVIDEIENA